MHEININLLFRKKKDLIQLNMFKSTSRGKKCSLPSIYLNFVYQLETCFLQASEFLHLQGKYNTQMHPKVFMVTKVYFLCLLVFLHLSYTRLFFFFHLLQLLRYCFQLMWEKKCVKISIWSLSPVAQREAVWRGSVLSS